MIPQLQQEAPVAPPQAVEQWSPAKKIAFRFIFSYFILYVYPRSVGSLGAFVKYNNPLKDMWHAVVPWVGANILHLSGDFTEIANGSGDQLYDYVLLFCIAVTALIAAAVWSVVDRKRPNYVTLYGWLRLFMRIVIAVAMISYGANKLWRMQFAEPMLQRYIDTFGQTSPMGLLWAMMGTSRAYSFFGGVGEMAGGLLLLVPDFTALGALVTAGVMTNVLMLNFCYDVPRKIYCLHLIAFCIFLLLPDLRRLADFFLFRRRTQLSPTPPLFQDKYFNYSVAALQVIIGIAALIICGQQAARDAAKEAVKIQGPLRGIWAVDEFSTDGATRLPLITDTTRWQDIVFDAPDQATVRFMDGSLKEYYMQWDPANHTITLWDTAHPHWKSVLNYTLEGDKLTLDGNLGSSPATAKTTRVDLSDPVKFLLINRGVHWVTDYPHNR